VKRLLLISLFAVVLAPFAHSQTVEAIAFNIGPAGFNCGVHWQNCSGVPVILKTDQGEIHATVWYDELAPASFIRFSTLLGTANGDGTGVFHGVDNMGRPYSVTLDPAPTAYKGCCKGYTYWRWTPESFISITF
jgi:hypothetical protein